MYVLTVVAAVDDGDQRDLEDGRCRFGPAGGGAGGGLDICLLMTVVVVVVVRGLVLDGGGGGDGNGEEEVEEFPHAEEEREETQEADGFGGQDERGGEADQAGRDYDREAGVLA